jgi:hypothetical protein
MCEQLEMLLLEHPQSTRHNPMPMVLFLRFWDEPGLWRSNMHFESHGTLLCTASEVHLLPFFCPLLEEPRLNVLVGCRNHDFD